MATPFSEKGAMPREYRREYTRKIGSPYALTVLEPLAFNATTV